MGWIARAGQAVLAASIWLAVSVPLFAQSNSSISAQIPPSEQLGRERFRFNEPRLPRSEPGGPGVALPSTAAPEGADKIKVRVRGIRIKGSTVYAPEELRVIYQDLIGHVVTLTAIYDVAQRITTKYGIDGYVLSRAIVPPQNLEESGAIIQIQVIEGYVDKVVWPAFLKDFRNYFDYYAARITAQRPANVRTIERYMLLASDLPGLQFKTSLKASEKNPNAATLFVEAIYKPIDAVARVDNRGTAARGPVQYLTAVTANNVFGAQDALTVTYAGVMPMRELEYFSATYRQVLTAEGLAFFFNASDGYGKPGTATLDFLQFKTKTLYLDSGFAFPVIRTREKNLSVSALFFASNSESDTFGLPLNDDRLRGTRARLDFDMADRWQGIDQLNIVVSQGINGLGSTPNNNPLASRPDGHVDFTKFEGTATRLQPLGGPWVLFTSVYGQYATTGLLTPEQCSFGGRFFGRAFDPSQLLSDSCAMGTVEVRYNLPDWWNFSQAQLYVFTDGAEMFNRVPSPGFPNWGHAASAGGGIRYGFLGFLTTDLTVAKAVNGPIDDTRFFFAATARY